MLIYGVFLNHSPLYFLRQIPLLNLELADSTRRAGCQAAGSSALGLQLHHYTRLFVVVLVILNVDFGGSTLGPHSWASSTL